MGRLNKSRVREVSKDKWLEDTYVWMHKVFDVNQTICIFSIQCVLIIDIWKIICEI